MFTSFQLCHHIWFLDICYMAQLEHFEKFTPWEMAAVGEQAGVPVLRGQTPAILTLADSLLGGPNFSFSLDQAQ